MAILSIRTFALTVSAGLYTTALCLPAYYESLPAIDAYMTFYGVHCLLAPVMIHPIVLIVCISWWANPAFGVAFFSLCRGWNKSAVCFGLVALLLALPFLRETHDFQPNRVLVGCWFWIGSMAAVTVGGLLASRPAEPVRSPPPPPPVYEEPTRRPTLDFGGLPKYPLG